MKAFPYLRQTIQLTALIMQLTALATGSCFGAANSTNIAVASNFNLAMKSLILDFEKNSKYRINPSYASSGKLFAQIRYGAPFSIFLSADVDKPKLLAEQNLGDRKSIFTYANGQLCLWTNIPSHSSTTVKNKLMNLNFNHLAIANPKLAPYGLAAQNTLSNLSLSSQTTSKLVLGENISQTFQFTLSKNAELGFVAFSQLKPIVDSGQIESSDYWLIPPEMHTPIKQNAILLNKAKNDSAALAFYEYLKSNKAKQIILKHGYQ